MEKLLEILGNVGFDWKVALANFVNFLIILFILNTFFFKSMGKMLDERKKKIVEGLTLRDEAERDRKNAFAEKTAILSQAREEETKFLQDAHEKAELLKTSLIAKAEKEAGDIVLKAEGELGRMKKELHNEWQEKSPKLVIDLTRKILSEKFTQDVNETYIKSLVK
ncbi:MAG: F0F1 ATP synthase subunit B [Minisyncoccia bacterium]